MNVSPNAELLDLFRSSGGGDKPAHGAYKVCYGQDEAECRTMAHRLWPNDALTGELGMILPTPAHFEQAAEPHRETIRQYAEAGYDEVYVQQVGPNQKEFFDLYEKEILPEFR